MAQVSLHSWLPANGCYFDWFSARTDNKSCVEVAISIDRGRIGWAKLASLANMPVLSA